MRAARLLIAGLLGVQPAAAKTLVYCAEAAPEVFNPQLTNAASTADATYPIYDRLIDFAPGTIDLVPSLAESWDISEGGTVFNFHLRHGVHWQSNAVFKPSRDLDADDIVFSFERLWREDNPYHLVSGGTYYLFEDEGYPKSLKAVEKLDDYTVRFRLDSPQATFLLNLATYSYPILSKEYADQRLDLGHPETIDREPIGTGPFEFVAYQKDTMTRYRRFAGYWGQAAKLDGLVFAITRDPATRLAKLRANECQIAPYPAPADLPSIRADPDLNLPEILGFNIGYVAFNTTHKPLDDVRVRRALMMAVDRKAILDAVYQGTGVPAKNLIPPNLWGWNAAIEDYPFDPEAAKRLLTEAGHGDGFDIDLWAMPVQRPYNPDARRIGAMMQADLAKIGVRARIVTYEWGEYLKRLNNGEHDLAQIGWIGIPDPEDYFRPLASCAGARQGGDNMARWCNPAFDALLDRAVALFDRDQRADLYRQAQVLMHDDAPFLPLAHAKEFLAMRRNVTGYVMSPTGNHRFGTVDLE